ncbi:transketolase [bacterium]|nr:transketolase [bacterium]
MNKSVNTLRMLAMDEINAANSGHPGVVLGFAPIAYTLWHDFLKITPKCPDWFDRDRFILASGHASSMLYALLHLFGYKVSMEDLTKFRKLGSLTPGHPEYKHTEGIDSTSGPLGQGIAMAAGMAIAETMLAARFNKEDIKLIDHYTYVECGDGDLQEGVTLEALSLIGRLKLNKLIILFDSNRIQLDGPVKNAGGINNPKEYFKSLGFNYLSVSDPENLDEVKKAIKKAKKSDLPSIVECHTIIGFGSPVANMSKSHGAPLDKAGMEVLKQNLGYTNEPFTVDDDVYLDYRSALNKNTRLYNKWKKSLKEYKTKYPTEFLEFTKVLNDDYTLSDNMFEGFEYKNEATRKTIGAIINIISKHYGSFVAGSADLTASTNVKGLDGSYDIDNRLGRNINYGVREHAMGAITNGLTLHHVRSMTGAFFVFSDYMKPAIRMAALMGIPSEFVFTHDSVAVGEDGPTHEPIEQLASLRSIPNINVFRPSDAKTTVQAVKYMMNDKNRPSVLCLTRQNLDLLDDVSDKEFKNGAFVRYENKNAKGTIVASGSEVSLALKTKDLLMEEGIPVRVVEMISTNLFDRLDSKTKEAIIPRNIPSLFLEMASPYGLYGYADYVYGINRFGASGNCNDVIPYLGFTKEKVSECFKEILKK